MNRNRKACTYKRYMTEQEAKGIQRKAWGQQEFLRVYRCSYCSGWHLARCKALRMEAMFSQIASELAER